MSVRIRLMLLFVVIGLVPMSIIVFQGTRSLAQMKNLVSTSNQSAIEKVYLQGIINSAGNFAKQVNAYLQSHPGLDLDTPDALSSNSDLAIIANQPAGKSGYLFIYDDGLNIRYHKNFELVGTSLADIRANSPELWNLLNISLISQHAEGYYDWKEGNEKSIRRYIAIQQVGNTSLRAASVIDADEISQLYSPILADFDRRADANRSFYVITGLVVALITLICGLILGRELTAGLAQMSEDASRIVMDLQDPIPLPKKHDELVILHNALTNMTKQVRDVRNNLEKQVHARTADLGRRNAQVEAAVRVAHEAADVLDVNQMLARTTELISESFGFYHTGIFLIDEANEYAILQATNSEGGKNMLERGHKLKIGDGSVVGFVVTRREPYIVTDTYSDSLHRTNPDLPRTRSELAVPLQVHGKILGVLDVQSTQPDAYNQDDVKILQILADQVALAIQNGRLLEESQRTLRELYHIYGQQIGRSWRQRVGRKPLAYTFNRISVEPAPPGARETTKPVDKPSIITEDEVSKLSVPISMRGQSLGSITLIREAPDGVWTNEDLIFMEEVATQIAPALENARLLEEIQRKAQLERQIGDISAKAQSSLDMETVIKSTVQELGLTVNAAKVQILLGTHERPSSHAGNGGGADRS